MKLGVGGILIIIISEEFFHLFIAFDFEAYLKKPNEIEKSLVNDVEARRHILVPKSRLNVIFIL